MKRITRKEFINLSVISSLAIPFIGYSCTGKKNKGNISESIDLKPETYAENIGFQVFTMREDLIENAEDLFRSLSAVGIRNIEFFDPATLNNYVPIVKDNGMNPFAVHFMPGYISGNWETAKKMGMPPPENYHFENILEDCNTNGIKYAGIAIMLQEERETLDHYRRFAEEVNKRAEQSKSAGIQLYYHNHSFEFESVDGTTPYDEMLKIFDPGLVKLELDVFWVTVGGQDPVQWLQRISDRLLFLHMKDRKKNSQCGIFDFNIPDDSFVELGTGMLDWKAILTATRDTSALCAIIDQDKTQLENCIDSVRMNVDYVRSLGI
jgi:sugar phosphate isomerase/epimerase